MCTKTTSVKKAEYLGVIKREDWRGKEQLAVQVLVDADKTVWRWADTKEDTSWDVYYRQCNKLNSRQIEAYSVPYKRVSTLQLNRIVPAKISAEKLAAAI
jgi:hypothetical protein